MAGLAGMIAEIAAQNNNAQQPADMLYGTVTGTGPLVITTDTQAAGLRESVLILTDEVREKKITVAGEEVEITKALSVGERVVLLQVQHGQKFIVLSRV